MEQKLKHYFKTYKDSAECFVTADEFIFHKRTDATAHAATLADKKVSGFTRTEVEAGKVETVKDETGKKPKAEKPKVEKPKAAKEPEGEVDPEGGAAPGAGEAEVNTEAAEGEVKTEVVPPVKPEGKTKKKAKADKK